MTRDFSGFLPPAPGAKAPPGAGILQQLGWQSFFATQISADEMQATPPVRAIEVNRSGITVRGDGIDAVLPPDAGVTVGDWLLYDAAQPAASRVLRRKSLLKRRAPGSDRQEQMIAANLDTAFIVTSCNHDFNVARLERYIVLALAAEVTPVIVLTKPDLCTEEERAAYVTEAEAISDKVAVVTLNALGPDVAGALSPWCRPGRTIAFLGSSGVGKSTLVNALAGQDEVATGPIREDDSRGRHTTTRRQLHLLGGRGALIDTPGMRELQMTEARSGLDDLFADLEDLAWQCRFRDCRHESEPGCAVQAAVTAGTIEPVRVARWQKLANEDAVNAANLAERKAKGRALSRLVREVKKRKPK